MDTVHRIRQGMSRAHPALFTIYAVVAAFSTYFCMYAYRKPFAAASYEGGLELPGLGSVDYKVLFILAQVFGYCLSKFIGIKVVSELPHRHRALAILVCIGIAQLGLVLFGLLPTPVNAVGLFVNGLPLGMVWGLVFGFLEGRRTSDLLGAGLCASFIVASGFVKSVGLGVLGAGVPETWMPAVVGVLFTVPLLVSVGLLFLMPEPNEADIAQRTERKPMNGRERLKFFMAYAPGLAALAIMYAGLTAYRDLRDNYAAELWAAMGWEEVPSILTTAEIPVAFGSLVVVAAIIVIRANKGALLAVHGVMLVGGLLIGVSTVAYQLGIMHPALWMILVGLGLYLGYVPNNCVLFDRLFAAAKWTGTAGFLIYVVDAFGYLASVGTLLVKNFATPNLPWLEFFVALSYGVAGLTIALVLASAAYFYVRLPAEEQEPAGKVIAAG